MPKPARSRRILRIALACLLVVGVYAALHLLLVLAFPQVLFSHSATHRGFTVHMREAVPPEIERVLDRVHSLLSASELYDPEVHREVFLLNSYGLARYLLLRNVHFGCNLPNGDTFVVNADVARDAAYCEKIGRNDRRARTLSDTIAHEIAHAMIREHLGRADEQEVPAWVKEGYCEFVSQGSSIDHELGLSILERGGASTPGLPNFKHRLMVEYLLRVRGLTVDELLRSPPPYRRVEAEVLAALRADEAGFLREIGTTIGSNDPARRAR